MQNGIHALIHPQEWQWLLLHAWHSQCSSALPIQPPSGLLLSLTLWHLLWCKGDQKAHVQLFWDIVIPRVSNMCWFFPSTLQGIPSSRFHSLKPRTLSFIACAYISYLASKAISRWRKKLVTFSLSYKNERESWKPTLVIHRGGH